MYKAAIPYMHMYMYVHVCTCMYMYVHVCTYKELHIIHELRMHIAM